MEGMQYIRHGSSFDKGSIYHDGTDIFFDCGFNFSGSTSVQNIVLGGNGRISTGSAAGTTCNIDATTSPYGQGLELRYAVTDWADTYTLTEGTGMYLRMENQETNSAASIYGAQIYGVSNNVANTKYLWGALVYAYVKGAAGLTATGVYALQPEITFDAATASSTITDAAVVRAKVTGGTMSDYTVLDGYRLTLGDMNGGSRTYGNGLLLEDDSDMSGTCSLTTGININIGCTTDISLQNGETIDNATDGYINLTGFGLVTVGGRLDVTTGYETYFKLDGKLDSTGSAGGVKTRGLHIDLERDTATVANGDSRDQALKIDIKDSVGDHTAGYFIRAMDVKSEFDSSGKTITALYGANFTAEVDNGTATDYMNVSFNSKCDGVVTNDLVNVRIYDESQGSITGDLIGLQFATKNVAPATGQREHVIEVTQADSSGWLNLFNFTNAANGYTCVKTGAYVDTDGQDSDGAIRIEIEDTAYYIPVFNAAHTSSSW